MSLSRGKWRSFLASTSLISRLTILNTLLTFALLLTSALFLFWVLRRDLDRKNSQFVENKIHELQAILRDQGEMDDALQREVVRETTVSVHWRYFARILGPRRELILETGRMSDVLPEDLFPATGGQRSLTGRDGRSYSVAEAAASGGRWIQFALDTTPEQLLLQDYRNKMVWILGVGLAVAAIAGRVVSRKGLQPLRDITEAAARIRATRLHERIGQRSWPRELASLAAVFDEMLGRLEDSFTRLSQFSADLAHELRTPVNVVMGEATLALSKARSADEYRAVLESSIEEYNRLSSIIENLLFLARADSDRASIQKVELSVGAQMQAVGEFFEPLSSEKGIEVRCEGDALLEADETLFRRALTNLVSNALNHTPAKGQVVMAVEETQAGIEVSVADTGCGIAPEHQSRVFDRFYRVDASRSSESRGSGLGLSIVRSILGLHGGEVSITSQPGKGTTVTVTFPRK